MNRPVEVEVAAPVPVRLFALATGVIVLSLYLPQPLVGLIGTSLGLSPAAAGLVSTVNGEPVSVLSFTIAGGRVAEIDILADPERLRRLDLTVLDD